MVKGLRSHHCSFFLRLHPPWFTDQPPWPLFTTCSFSMMSSSHILSWACLCVAGSFSSLRCQPLRVSPARCLLWRLSPQLHCATLWYLLSNLYPTKYFLLLDCFLVYTRLQAPGKQEAWLWFPVGTPTSSTVATFCPPHGKHPISACRTNRHRNEEWAAITTGSGWKGP